MKEVLDNIVKNDNNGLDISLLEKLLSEDYYYEFLKKGIMFSHRSFGMPSNPSEDLIKIKKQGNAVEVLNLIKKAYEKGQLKLDDKEKENYEFLMDNVSIDKFIEKYKDQTFSLNVKDKKIDIPCNYFIEFLTSSDKEYESFFEPENTNYREINKMDFIYSFIKFINRDFVYKKFIFPDKYMDRLNEISEYKKLDVEYLYYSNSKPTVYDNLDSITITEELKKEILDGIPDNFDSVRKAVYIYIKLCKILSYADEFFALGQRLNGPAKYRNLDNVSSITPNDNEVVCYQFCAIYAKFLKTLGFDYEIDGDPLGMILGTHQYLKTLLDKYFISIDSVTSILHGDMIRAKLNEPLVGIKCLNKNEKSQEEFRLIMVEVYSLIVKQEQNKLQDYATLTFDELLKEYNDVSEQKEEDISFQSKIKILIRKAEDAKFKPVDTMSYMKILTDVLFNTDEKKDNANVSIICDKKNVPEDKEASLSAVFTIKENDMILYFLYNNNSGLFLISRDELQEMFKKQELCYIDRKNGKIQGISDSGAII